MPAAVEQLRREDSHTASRRHAETMPSPLMTGPHV